MKKKGLIVATIVMVVVMAVSLTTATYAWFTLDAQATLENLTISAKAVEGVEIAVKTTNSDSTTYSTGYTNGTLEYSPEPATNWTSQEQLDGFGTLLDFGAVDLGQITNAVTKTTKTNLNVYEKFATTVGETSVDGKYYFDESGVAQSASGKALSGVEYYTSKGTSTAGKFYRPIAYNGQTPTAYEEIAPNQPKISYYDLPLAVKTTKAAKAIMLEISLVNNATGSLVPGMAAATRVEITINGNTYTWEPYENCVYSKGGMTGYTASEGTLRFVIAGGFDIALTDIFDFQVKIWVEGEDNECQNATTVATDFYVDFTFDWFEGAVTVGSPVTKGEGSEAKTYQWLKDGENAVYYSASPTV